jgi:hypothetical protein
MHFLKSAENGMDGSLDFQWLELVLGLDLVVELSPL